jgi:SET domain-containing protein
VHSPKRKGKPHSIKPMFSLSPVQFRDSRIEGRGVFARRSFGPGDVIVPYAPRQRRVYVEDPEAVAAADTKLTLLSERWWVVIPDTSVPGGWLCNHSCDPNAAIYSDGEGRIQCTRAIAPGEEVTIFYGWVTQNQPERDPCRCGSLRCRGFINFDLSAEDAAHVDDETAAGVAFRRRIDEYAEYLASIGQEQVLDTIAGKLAQMKSKAG